MVVYTREREPNEGDYAPISNTIMNNINLWNDCCKVVVQKLFALGRKARRTNNNNNVNMEYSDKR